MQASPRMIVNRMIRGVRALERKREERLRAGDVKILSQGGVHIPYPYPPPPKEKRKDDHLKVPEGIEITSVTRPGGAPLKVESDKESLRGMNIKYPLIPATPRKGEAVFAYTNIVWRENELGYIIVEPDISAEEKDLIDKIKRNLEERLDIDFTKLGDIKAKQVLREEIHKSFTIVPDLPEERKAVLSYYIERDLIGLGKIETLMRDPNIEDISCDGVGIPLFVFHRDPKFGSMRTNVIFDTIDDLNSFVGMLAQKCNKTLSIAEPLLDGALPDGSRVQATLGTDIARKGSNFTIRKFTDRPLTPTHMLKFKTVNSLQLAYIWLAIENGRSILVSGGTATGKTSMLNAMSLFIRPSLKVVSIEDTAELRLPLPHWIPHVARTPLSIKGKMGEVTLFDLLKTSLRQRPDYIIVGEVRGREAFVLFQQMATGHPAMATIHAASIPQLIDRLITPPISLPPSLMENIDIILFLTFSRLKGHYVRRANNILEVVGIKKNMPESLRIFQWKPVTDNFEITDKSVVLRKIAERMGITEESILQELYRRKQILEWMLDKEIFDYRQVARIISVYYHDPERVMSAVESGR